MNAKDNETTARFIELRAQGWTFARLAAELNVSKPTLISWSRKYQHSIHNLRALETESLADQCKISHRISLENLAEDVRRIREELARRDLGDIPTARLFVLSARLRAEASRLNGPLHFAEPISETAPDENQFPDPTLAWEA